MDTSEEDHGIYLVFHLASRYGTRSDCDGDLDGTGLSLRSLDDGDNRRNPRIFQLVSIFTQRRLERRIEENLIILFFIVSCNNWEWMIL